MFSPGKVVGRGGPNEPPLCEIAPWKSPFASGDAHSMLTAMPPADSPKIVTLLRIAAERRDVLLHPLQARDHVEQTVVARDVILVLGAQLRVRQKSEGPTRYAMLTSTTPFLANCSPL